MVGRRHAIANWFDPDIEADMTVRDQGRMDAGLEAKP